MLGGATRRCGSAKVHDPLEASLGRCGGESLRTAALELPEVRAAATHAVHQVVGDLNARERGGKCFGTKQVTDQPAHARSIDR